MAIILIPLISSVLFLHDVMMMFGRCMAIDLECSKKSIAN